ncbi:hypothetical protein TNCV_4707881 [Trichonephila clavipes]|nr:hypothetical protein TNCV_4707881 [Trichonephila clavipes]
MVPKAIEIYRYSVVSETQVYMWCTFTSGEDIAADDDISITAATGIIDTILAVVDSMIFEDRRVRLHDMIKALNIAQDLVAHTCFVTR